MFRRLLTLGVRGYVGGPAKSWVFTSAALLLWRGIRKVTSGTKLIDLSNTKPGDRIVIEHLDITHKQQMKELKHARKADKATARMVKRELRAAKKQGRAF